MQISQDGLQFFFLLLLLENTYYIKSMYLNIGKIYIVLFKEANEFSEVLFCRVIMTTVWPNSLR